MMTSTAGIRDGQLSLQEFKELQNADRVLEMLISQLRLGRKTLITTNPTVRLWARKFKYLVLDKSSGLLYIEYQFNKRRIHQSVVPDALVGRVLFLKHDNAGHMAAGRPLDLFMVIAFG